MGQKLGNITWGGLTFGPGTPYAVAGLSGLDDLPDVRTQDIARPTQNGDYTGPDYLASRLIDLDLNIIAPDPDTLRALTLALRNATQPGSDVAPLVFVDQGIQLQVKVRKRALPYNSTALDRTGSASLEFYCPDPTLYSSTQHSAQTTAYSPSAGRTYPLPYAAVTASTNWVLNPTSVDLTNSVTYDPATTGLITRAVSTTGWHKAGSTSAQITMGGSVAITGGWSYELGSTFATGTQVTGSVYVYTAPGVALTDYGIIWRNGVTKIGEAHITPVPGTVQRITSTFTVPAGQTLTRMAVCATGPGGSVWLADAAQVEPGATATPYFDGATGGTWAGMPFASASTRPAGTGRTYGTPGASGQLTATNAGAAPSYPTLRIDGPVANPSIEQTNVGGALQFTGTLAAGDYLTIDTRTRAVVLNDSTPRRSWLSGGATWPLLLPGDNSFVFRGTALPGSPLQASLLTVTWRDASL